MSKMAQQWFEVDKQGLADLVSSKGKVFILHELLQNAWDCQDLIHDGHGVVRQDGQAYVENPP